MGYVGLKTNSKEEQEIEELEILLRRMDPLQRIGSRSAAIKEAVRIALFHVKNSYFYRYSLTKPKKEKTATLQARPIKRIMSSDIDLNGRRKQ